MRKFASIVLALLVLQVTSIAAAQSLDIPCSACPAIRRPPLPESGFWHNPLQPGVGFALEVQRQTLAGAHFAYTASGAPVWYVFSGILARTNTTDVAWSVDAQAFELAGGPCLGCAYIPPSAGSAVARLRFEFLQRGLARYRVDDGPWGFIHPFIYGVASESIFTPETVYPYVDLEGPWVLVFQDTGAQGEEASRRAFTAFVAPSTDPFSHPEDGVAFRTAENASESLEFGSLSCPVAGDGTPFCKYTALGGLSRFTNAPAKDFILPLGNLTDSRFKGEAADGETVEAYRLNYD